MCRYWYTSVVLKIGDGIEIIVCFYMFASRDDSFGVEVCASRGIGNSGHVLVLQTMTHFVNQRRDL